GRNRWARPNLPKNVTPRTSGTLRTVADDSVGAEPGELVLPEPEHPAQDRAVVLPQSRRRRAQPTPYARIAERKHRDGVRAHHRMRHGLEEAACAHLWVLAHTTRVHHRRRRDPRGQKPRHERIALMLGCPRGERRVDPVVRRALISRTIHPFEALISTAWSGNRCGRRWRATRSSSSNRSRILHATSGHPVPRPDLGPPMRGHRPERTSA